MAEKKSEDPCCSPAEAMGGCCKVEAVIGIDERGQMVLPKDLREKAGIHAGDKLAVVSMQKDGSTCCLTLIKAEELAGMVKDLLGPVMAEIIK
ncbi:MAG: AbrB/MazE/SpoVT family DNA-binding domain-containing protein [Dehalococcoidales bacterium]|nr:AbrB/MazE/SpoVT family DNA-binding domain-containing protein [Dehalococcoidales bacterium]